MVSAFRAESIRDPTDSLEELYRTYLERGNQSKTFPRFVSEHFANVFEQDNAFQEVRSSSLQIYPRILSCFCLDSNSQCPTSPWFISRSGFGSLPSHGPGYFSIFRNVSFCVQKWFMWRLGDAWCERRRRRISWGFRLSCSQGVYDPVGGERPRWIWMVYASDRRFKRQ